MKKAYVLGFIVGAVLLIGGGVAGSRLQKKNAERQQELALYRAELVDATPVQLGVLTEKQRIHSRLYTHYQEVTGRKSLSDLAAKAKGKDNFVGIEVHVGLGEVLTEPETPDYYFGKLARKSDAVIRGTVINKTSQITQDDSFVFTDYDIIIAEVLKDNKASHIETGATITITHPGGKVVLDDVIVKAIDDSYEPLPVNKDLILFLKLIPATGTYQVTEATGSFELNGSSFRPLTGVAFPPGVLQDRNSFVQTLRVVSKE